MALQLSENYKGITANYWKIVDCNVKTGQVLLGLFVSKQYSANRENMIKGRESFTVIFDLPSLETSGMNPIKFAYQEIKKSKLVPEIDKLGNLTGNMIESNKFINAIDI